jgi:hypothetical protein
MGQVLFPNTNPELSTPLLTLEYVQGEIINTFLSTAAGHLSSWLLSLSNKFRRGEMFSRLLCLSIEMKQKEKLGEDLLLTSAQDSHYYSDMRYTLLLNSPTEYCMLEEEAGALCYAKNRV